MECSNLPQRDGPLIEDVLCLQQLAVSLETDNLLLLLLLVPVVGYVNVVQHVASRTMLFPTCLLNWTYLDLFINKLTVKSS